jgi:hypothetical protein
MQPLTAAAPASQELGSQELGSQELARRGKQAAPAEPSAIAARALADHVFIEGGDQPARPNRADDFSWRGGAAH